MIDPEKRADLLGDELTTTIERITNVLLRFFPADRAEVIRELLGLLGDFWALTLGRATELASGAVVKAIRSYEERLGAVERAVGDRADSDG